ncbi:MAG: methylated-DNA--[protein]-cysteine S-methyltransferase [Candidatus Thorarchaeota archaeon]
MDREQTGLTYVIFPTEMGHCGAVFRKERGRPLAVRVYLPAPPDMVVASIRREFPDAEENTGPLPELCHLIQRYLRGEDLEFPLELIDLSVVGPFQRAVLLVDREIPRGMVASYAWVAGRLGNQGSRAVGNAQARNPFPIVVPCHRVIRSDGTLGGFGGGPDMKKRLLRLEGVYIDEHGHVSPPQIIRHYEN